MGGGGGATHIATQSGVLSSLSSTTNSILVVAGGGGGTYDGSSSPSAYGHGGGYVGQTGNARSTGYVSYGGTQIMINLFAVGILLNISRSAKK